jgi:hypothetical protein
MIFKPNGFSSLNQRESPATLPDLKLVTPVSCPLLPLFGIHISEKKSQTIANSMLMQGRNIILPITPSYTPVSAFLYTKNYRKFNTHAVQQYHLSVASSHVMFNTMYLYRYRTGITGITQKKNKTIINIFLNGCFGGKLYATFAVRLELGSAPGIS